MKQVKWMERIVILEQGRLKGAFKGFKNRDTEFQFYGGQKWRQAEYLYDYHYAYMPDAQVRCESGRNLLYVSGMDRPVEVRRA